MISIIYLILFTFMVILWPSKVKIKSCPLPGGICLRLRIWRRRHRKIDGGRKRGERDGRSKVISIAIG
jgi:hypothetical protein